MSLFETLKLLIIRGKTDGLSAKIESLYKGGKLTQEEYETLMALLEQRE